VRLDSGVDEIQDKVTDPDDYPYMTVWKLHYPKGQIFDGEI
jgi:hypothetical protein